MAFSSIVREIEKTFTSAWSGQAKLYYVNQTITSTTGEHIRIQVMPSNAAQSSFGASKNNIRVTGIVTVQVFVLNNTGTGRVYEIADEVLNILQVTNIVGDDYSITLEAGYADYVNVPVNAAYLQINVKVPFFADYQ